MFSKQHECVYLPSSELYEVLSYNVKFKLSAYKEGPPTMLGLTCMSAVVHLHNGRHPAESS